MSWFFLIGNKFTHNMQVPFTFCSLVLKAESSLFEAHIWPKKGFQKQERRTWRFVRFHTPRTICFLLTARKMCDRQSCVRELSKSSFSHSKSHFLCDIFALDFISWLISWQRGVYAENNFFKKCPFPASLWASSFGTKFVLLEAYLHGQIRSIWIGVRKKILFVWPVNKHVNCQVKDIELQFIVAPPRPHHTMLAISCVHLRMIWSTLFGRGQGEG